MADLIYRQQAVDAFETAAKSGACIEDIKLILAEMPSAQPDIIRCKDCAYCDSDVVDVPYGFTKKIWWCNRLYAGANENLAVDPDDFCSYGKGKEHIND